MMADAHKYTTHYTWMIAMMFRNMVNEDKGDAKTGRPETHLVHTSRDGNTGKQTMIVVVNDVPHLVTIQMAETKAVQVGIDGMPKHAGAWN